jgi:hypothetical protein
VFFDADDGWNDGVGFAIFAADGKKLFDDIAKSLHAIDVTPAGIAVRYIRVFGAYCSLRADAAGCWQRIKRDTGLAVASPPDCTAAYARAQKRTPAIAQQVIADPTVIDYEAEAAIAAARKRLPLSRARPSAAGRRSERSRPPAWLNRFGPLPRRKSTVKARLSPALHDGPIGAAG